MTTETRKRIRAYQKMLPELRERVIAVALLLAMSASMLGSASFAWITLSRAPEVSGMSTTVAANGNLEIALAQGTVADGKIPPLESQVGDSSSTERENWGITNANVTWGNLVNLSDSKYGLDKISLRPALLSSYGLDVSPLHGASYGQDGRVIDTIEQYGYASLKDTGDGNAEFTAGEDVQYGVRAVSSMRTENTVGANRLVKFEQMTNKHYGDAMTSYKALVSDGKSGSVTPTKFNGKSAVSALESLVTAFAKEKVLNQKTSYADYVWYLHQMMIELRRIMVEYEALGLLEMANWQAYIYNKNVNDKTFASFDQLVEKKNSLSSYGVTLTTLQPFLNDLATLDTCIADMQDLADACDPTSSTATYPNVTWDELTVHVNKMVDLSTATLEAPNKGVKETLVYNLGSDMSDALNLLGETNAIIRIKKGVIYNFEDRHSDALNRMKAYVTISIMGMSISGNVITTADDTPNYVTDLTKSKNMDNSGASGQQYAKDTYGMAIDMWVRTNAPESILTLEGTTIYEYEDVTFRDSDNNLITVYELSLIVDEVREVYDIYQNPDDKKWYFYNDHSEVPDELLSQGSKDKKQTKKVTGFRGENRIWEDWETLLENGFIAEDATTQGAGSCFVFYADTPAEQEKLKEMLHAFAITFIDAGGNAVATATLDTENAYINQGKITAPLVVETGVPYLDEDNVQKQGIMALTQNQATWLTALVYLKGDLLQNDNVLATSSIVGQLNLQFGNTTKMEVRDDEELQMQYRSITAEAISVEDPTKISTNSTDVIEYEYAASGHEVKVNLTVEGTQPERISAFFIRAINEAQGTRGDSVDFKDNKDGTWTGTFKLTAPGTYVLNSLTVDGIEYQLRAKTQTDKGNQPSVVINGLKLENVRTTHLSGTYMTDQSSIQVGVYAKIEADPALTPKTVWAQFFSEDGSKQYNGQLKFNPNNDGGTWEGTVSLNSSGTYILRYLTIDGTPEEVSANSQVRLVCTMGMYCRIICAEDAREFLYKGEPFNLGMSAVVMDDNDQPLKDLKNVHLYYHSDSSGDDDQGMHALLTWNDSESAYTGSFELRSPGTYSFNRLEIGSNTLGSARVAPVFTASTPVPPSWSEGSAAAKARQLAFDSSNPATLSLRLKDAASATVWAELERMILNDDGSYTGTGETIRVQNGTKNAVDDTTEFGFTLTQDGIWKLKKVLCQGVYNDTTPYPVGGATYYEVAVPGEEQIVTDIVMTINSELNYNGSKQTASFTEHFGAEKQSDGSYKATGAIFTEYKPSVQVQITDKWGKAIPELTAVNWNVQHSNANMISFGGYSGNAINDGKNVSYKMTGETTVYTTPTVTMDLAGEYKTSVTATFDLGDGKTYNYEVPVKPQFNVYSVAPTVKISATEDPGGGGSKADTSATVTYSVKSDCTGTDYRNGSVTITLTGYGKASSAYMVFSPISGNTTSNVNLFATQNTVASDRTDRYSWTADGGCKRYVGMWKSQTGTDTIEAAGTIKATQLTMTSTSGKTVTFAMSSITANSSVDITINNPKPS